jgi:hypothetical protein
VFTRAGTFWSDDGHFWSDGCYIEFSILDNQSREKKEMSETSNFCPCVRHYPHLEEISIEYHLIDPKKYPGTWAVADCANCFGTGFPVQLKQREEGNE